MNFKRWALLKVIMLVLLIIFSVANVASIAATLPSFSVDKANTTLTSAWKLLNNTSKLNSQIDQYAVDIKKLNDNSRNCANEGIEDLKRLNTYFKDDSLDKVITDTASANQYIKNQRQLISQKIVACRIFSYKSNEFLNAYKERIQLTSFFEKPSKTQPIWISFSNVIASKLTLSTEKLYINSGITKLNVLNAILIVASILIGIVLAWFVNHGLSRSLSHKSNLIILNHIVTIIKYYSYWLVPLVLLSIVIFFIYRDDSGTILIAYMVYAGLAYCLTLMLLKIILFIPESGNSKRLVKYDGLYRPLISMSSVILIGYLGSLVLIGVELSQSVVYLLKTGFVILLIIMLMWLIYEALNVIRGFIKINQMSMYLIYLLIYSLFFLLIIAEILGYSYISAAILKSLVLSVLLGVVLLGVLRFIDYLFIILNSRQYRTSQIIRKYTSVRIDRYYYEFSLLKLAIYFVILYISIYELMYIWNISVYYIEAFQSAYINGFTVLNIHIVPNKIIFALILFSLANLSGRLYSTHLARERLRGVASHNQVAISSIINYISFTVALLIALFVSGVNFTGLAIIAGALSVGIGFGLQNIVNNFLCGLILLIQKPVKLGDRVVVSDYEGFVREIRLLSTQIKTVSREDVIIPNSHLISAPIKNYMYKDSLWRVCSKVGVKYGSDIYLVKEILLAIAKDHPDVIQEGENAPMALFTGFGDSSLDFELWCIIDDVNKRFKVSSDINFMINAAFKDNGIEIPFPQRDLHIKQ